MSAAGTPPRPVRVVVVDDSRLMRRMVSSALQSDGTIEVVGEAEDTSVARRLIKELDPDVVTLDVEMPGMNGIDFLKKIMELRPMPVIMVSTLTASGTDISIAALSIGAVDAICKPAGRESVGPFGRALRQKVLVASRAQVRRTISKPAVPPSTPVQQRPINRSIAPRGVDLVALGASTGGVAALTELLERIPPSCPPIVITQHMPAGFTGRFAARLDSLLPLSVAEAQHDEVLSPGQVRIAPGDQHLLVQRSGNRLVTKLDDSGPISGHRPSVDVLFNSVSTAVGSRAVGAILTGMGRDGAAGLRAMRQSGAACLGQDEQSAVVYGMPGAAKALGAFEEEYRPSAIADRISDFLNPGAARQTA